MPQAWKTSGQPMETEQLTVGIQYKGSIPISYRQLRLNHMAVTQGLVTTRGTCVLASVVCFIGEQSEPEWGSWQKTLVCCACPCEAGYVYYCVCTCFSSTTPSLASQSFCALCNMTLLKVYRVHFRRENRMFCSYLGRLTSFYLFWWQAKDVRYYFVWTDDL